jgi:ankyrin repeat protein
MHPLHVAGAATDIADQRVMEMIELFVDHDVDAFKQTTKFGRTSLHEAAAAGKSCDICKKLIKLSPLTLESRTHEGELPFMLAACNEEKRRYKPNLETVYTLIRANPGLIVNQSA